MTGILEKEYLLETILEQCEDIISLKDLNFNYVAYNKAFLRVIGKDDSFSAVGKSVYDVNPPKYAEIIVDTMKEVIRTRKIHSSVFELERGDSSIILKQTHTPIVRNGVLEGVLTISVDITREECYKAKLYEKNNQLRCLLENLPVIAYMKDKDFNVSLVPKKSECFLSDGIDKFSDNIVIDMERTRAEDLNEDNYVKQTKEMLVKEKAAVDIDNKVHWYRVYKAPILTDNNEFDGMVTLAKNIDRERALENQRSLFLATLTHDLKNPLQAQISSLELFYKGAFGNLNDTQKEMLEMIIESSKYMRSMLYSFLKTGKEQTGVINLERSYFDIVGLIDKCIREVVDLASSKNIKIEFKSEVKDGEHMLYADEMEMRRVVSNILNNGINYAFSDTVLKVKIKRDKDNFFIDFENTSEIIPDDLAECIFDKYVCGNPLTSTIGVGLGLYFCHKVLNAHQGKISLDRDGHKNTFKIQLPILSEKSAFINEIVL